MTVIITNTGNTAVNGWTLTWTFPANQTITDYWSATITQNGAAASATNVSYNSYIPVNASVEFGFNITYSGSNPSPTDFTLNGSACN